MVLDFTKYTLCSRIPSDCPYQTSSLNLCIFQPWHRLWLIFPINILTQLRKIRLGWLGKKKMEKWTEESIWAGANQRRGLDREGVTHNVYRWHFQPESSTQSSSGASRARERRWGSLFHMQPLKSEDLNNSFVLLTGCCCTGKELLPAYQV